MGLIRFILIVCVIWLLLELMQKLRQLGQVRQKHHQQKKAGIRKQTVQCTSCRVYLPKDDALRKGDNYFCCTDHMETEPKKNQ